MAEPPSGDRRRLPGSTVPRRRGAAAPRAVLPVDDPPPGDIDGDTVDVEEYVSFRPVAGITPETMRAPTGGPSLIGWSLVMIVVILGIVAWIAYRMAPP